MVLQFALILQRTFAAFLAISLHWRAVSFEAQVWTFFGLSSLAIMFPASEVFSFASPGRICITISELVAGQIGGSFLTLPLRRPFTQQAALAETLLENPYPCSYISSQTGTTGRGRAGTRSASRNPLCSELMDRDSPFHRSSASGPSKGVRQTTDSCGEHVGSRMGKASRPAPRTRTLAPHIECAA